MTTQTENGRRQRGPLADFVEGFASFVKGMSITFVNLVGREKITVQYPYEQAPVSPRWRGLFYLPLTEDKSRLKCVGCTLCEQACPTKVITMTKLGTGKHAGVSEFNMDLGRCMFCNLCIEACPFDAIYMGPIYELASSDRNACVFDIDRLTPGGAESVERNNTNIRAALAEEEAKKAAAAIVAAEKAAAQTAEGAE
jgi:NADH-quinone oxidoreductase subunit I